MGHGWIPSGVGPGDAGEERLGGSQRNVHSVLAVWAWPLPVLGGDNLGFLLASLALISFTLQPGKENSPNKESQYWLFTLGDEQTLNGTSQLQLILQWVFCPVAYLSSLPAGPRVETSAISLCCIEPFKRSPCYLQNSLQFNFIRLSINRQGIITHQNYLDLKARRSLPCSPWAVT